MKKAVLFLLLLFSSLLYAQQDALNRILLSEEHTAARLNSVNSPNRLYEFAMEYPEVQGVPYLNKEEKMYVGSLFLSDGTKLENIAFKYNIYEDAVEVNLEGKRINLDPEQVTGFTFVDPETGEERIFRNGFKVDNAVDVEKYAITSSSYFEVLYEGKEVIVLRHWSKGIESPPKTTTMPGLGNAATTYHFSDPKEDAFIIKRGYFLPVKLNRTGFLEAFADERDQVRRFIKDKWLRCKTTEELARVAAYYDRMLERREARKKQN